MLYPSKVPGGENWKEGETEGDESEIADEERCCCEDSEEYAFRRRCYERDES